MNPLVIILAAAVTSQSASFSPADLNRALTICGALAADGEQLPVSCDAWIAASMAMQLGLPHVADLVRDGKPTAADLRWLRELRTP